MVTRKFKSIAIAGALFVGFTVSAADKVTYEDHILPIFRNSCLKCHNADKMKADLDISDLCRPHEWQWQWRDRCWR